MGYLDNDTVVVDAILTKHGRKLLLDGFAINPTHFALSDDGVDYTLWNPNSPSGSSGYDDYISKLPMIEAVPDDAVSMHYTLISLPQNTQYMPVVMLSNSPNTENRFTLDNDTIEGDIVRLDPSVKNWGQKNPTFNFLIMDATALDVVSHDGYQVGISGTDPQPLEQGTSYPVHIYNSTHLHLTDITVTQTWITSIVIEHTDSGAQLGCSVKVLKSDKI